MELTLTSLKKYQIVLLHILAWAIIFLLPIIFAPEVEDGAPRSVHEREFLYVNTITKVFWLLLFYLNIAVLIPRLLYKKKYVIFVLAQVLLFAAIIGIRSVYFEMIVTKFQFVFSKSAFHNSMAFLFTVLGSIAYKTVLDRLRSERLANEQQRENLKTELSFLRSQISPHFLFNVLNNIVALVRMKSEKLEPTILKLSSLMQYMLYESDDGKVLLISEVNYLQSYIDLQRLRFGNRLTVNVDLQIDEDWHVIEPMLLIPFVENAFKHGTGMIEDPVIDISLISNNNELLFTVKNKYIKGDETKDNVSGIGLTNVTRRLELLYGNDYTLTVHKSGEWFTVSLRLIFES